MLRALGLTLLIVVLGPSTACKRDQGALTAKPHAVELEEDGESNMPPPVAPTAAPSPAVGARAAPSEPGSFPLPLIAGAAVTRRYPPVVASTREMQQLAIKSRRPIAELVAYYERALAEAGYTVTKSVSEDEEQVLLQGKGRVGRAEAVVAVMRGVDGDDNTVTMTITRMIKP